MPQLKIENVTLNAKGTAFFDVVIAGQAWRRDKTTNTIKGIYLVVEIENDGPNKGDKAYVDFGIGPKQWEYSREKLEKLFGYTGGVQGLDAANFVGEICSMAVSQREYQGKMHMNCNLFPRKPPPEPPTRDELLALAVQAGEDVVVPEKKQAAEDQWKKPVETKTDDLPF